jgi:hypothetical protein
MRILVHESTDKTQRKILEIPKEHLLHLLKIDNGYFEVIPMEDPSAYLRVYFDIETYENIDVLGEALDVLNSIFKTTNENWAISNGSRNVEKDYKISYHILSKKYKMSLNDLRLLVKSLNKSYIDYTAYWFIIDYKCDEGAFRLPNQSKMGINKIGTPMTIVQGEIADFFVTDVCNLEVFSLNN